MLSHLNQQLAILGGKPLRMAPLAPWPYFERDEVEAVCDVLRSGKINYWTGEEGRRFEEELDRKSTRLNSSHGYISYAVFCLKKKKKTYQSQRHAPASLVDPPVDSVSTP